MSTTSDAFLRKAEESLAGAASELSNGRTDNAANRMYYACFQAAIAALEVAGVRPRRNPEEWPDSFVQAQFAGLLINRRKRYPSELRDVLAALLNLRLLADYREEHVSRVRAERAYQQPQLFVNAVRQREEGEIG